MNTSNTLKRAILVAAVCAGTAVAHAQYGYGLAGGNPQGQAGEHFQNSNALSQTNINQPTPAEKASGLLGMPVRNPEGQRLGSVHDFVLDLKSGKISYLVLATGGGFFGLGQKLVAIPWQAFKRYPDMNYLSLNVSKKTLREAKGLRRNHWPSAISPSWGAKPFWQQSYSQNQKQKQNKNQSQSQSQNQNQ